VAFRSPQSDSDSDSVHSAYSSAENPPSVLSIALTPEELTSSKMNDDRMSVLEQAFSGLQAQQAETQTKLDAMLQMLMQQQQRNKTPPPRSPTPAPPTPNVRAPPPALPTEFDGDRSKGLAFLNSCQTYIRLCPGSFSDDQTKITWALSYMKSGRASKWAARIFKYEEEEGQPKFLDWSDFRSEFRKEFFPAHSDAAAINKLETTSYFQRTRSVDKYLDEFLDLIAEAGYTDPKTLVVKFRRGLNPQVQNAVATMSAGRPSDISPTAWYEAARNVDQNRASNEAFQSSFRSTAPTRPTTSGVLRPPTMAHIKPSPGNPVPMDLDANRRRTLLPPTCYRCKKPGHKSPECPLQFDVRTLTIEDLETLLADKYAKLDVVPLDESLEEPEENSVQLDFAKDDE
jgi:hypothetical protein